MNSASIAQDKGLLASCLACAWHSDNGGIFIFHKRSCEKFGGRVAVLINKHHHGNVYAVCIGIGNLLLPLGIHANENLALRKKIIQKGIKLGEASAGVCSYIEND